MSRAFVNEERFEQAGGEELVDRPISEFANYVTPTGALALQDQEAALMAELAPLKKSADDAFNKDKVAELERDLRYLRVQFWSTPPDKTIQPYCLAPVSRCKTTQAKLIAFTSSEKTKPMPPSIKSATFHP